MDEVEGEGYFLISKAVNTPADGKAPEVKIKHFKSKRFAMDKLKSIQKLTDDK